MSTLGSVILRDVIANRPAAGIPGRLFFASDTGVNYRDNGTSWDVYSGGGTGSVTSIATAAPITGGTITTTGTIGLAGTDINSSGNVVATHLASPLPVAQGGTGTASPSLVAGTNVTITGTWPNQTVASTGSSGITVTNVALSPSSPGNFTVAHGIGTTPTAANVAMSSGGQIWFQSTPYDGTNLYLVASDGGVTGNALVFH